MTDVAADTPATPPASALDEAVRKKNQRLMEFYDKQFEVSDLAEEIRRLIGTSSEGVDQVLRTMADIETCLETMEDLFQELGCIPDAGEFDEFNYRWIRIERRIADRKIRELSEVPEEFQDSFRHVFDDPYDTHRPRDTESIRDDIEMQCEILREDVGSCYDFSDFMPQGRTRTSPKLDALRDELNRRWDEFKSAAKAVAYHF